MKRISILVYIVFSYCLLQGQNINIKLFSRYNIRSIEFRPVTGKYEIVSEKSVFYSIHDNEPVFVRAKGNKIKIVKSNGRTIGTFSKIHFRGTSYQNYFKITPAGDSIKVRTYDDDIHIEAKEGYLKIINDVNFEKYISGVVESEGGSKSHIEYYKSQAILCRTYAIKEYQKHLADDYNLCDDVHCQAYLSRSSLNQDIPKATIETSGLVIVDSLLNLISAVFFSNSGGQTVNSDDVWQSALPYLRSVPDSFSLGQPNYMWERVISKSEWINYLKKKGIQEIQDSMFVFLQSERKKNYEYAGIVIPLKTIRSDWKLKSTFFSISHEGENLIFHGRGYGHGVGLAQEGAMKMALVGYNYQQIIQHYYKNVNIVSLKALNFFQID